MNNENYCNVFVHVLTDGHFVPLGQLILTTRIRDVANMVLAKKKLEGLQILSLGYMVPPDVIVYLPPGTMLSEAKSDIMRVSYLCTYYGRASTVIEVGSSNMSWVSVLHGLG